MEELNRQGGIRAIGVSNLYPDRLVDLMDHNEIPPAVNQIETHPYFQRADCQQLMDDRGVHIESWGPLAEGRNNERMAENLAVFDFRLSQDDLSRIAALDAGASLFFDHRDPKNVTRLGGVRVT